MTGWKSWDASWAEVLDARGTDTASTATGGKGVNASPSKYGSVTG